MPRVVHERTDGVGLELFTRIGAKQGLQRFCLVDGGIEPLVVGRGGQYDRHPVVNRSQQLVRVRCKDRTGFDSRAFRRLPLFPQPGKRERLFALQLKQVFEPLPFDW